MAKGQIDKNQQGNCPYALSLMGQPLRFLLVAVWFGLLTGLGEVALLSLRKYLFERILFLGRHFIWMAPVADVLLFLGVGGVLWLIGRRWPRLLSFPLSSFVFAFIAGLSLLLIYPRLNNYAVVLLAGGIAVQGARIIGQHASGFYWLVRKTAASMAGLVLFFFIALNGRDWVVQRTAVASLTPAEIGAPNVLLIVLDTVRAQSLSIHGYPRSTTPNIESFAKTGVMFERAISPSPWTTPSHASIFTGRFPRELSVVRSKFSGDGVAPLDGTYPTLAETLRYEGYLTAGFVANFEYCGYETGLDRGFAHYEDYPVSLAEMVLSSSFARKIVNYWTLRQILGYHDIFSRKTAPDVNERFLRWLDRKENRPFFVFLNYYDAHAPYLPPTPFDVRFGQNTARKNFLIRPTGVRQAERENMELMSLPEIQAELDAYEGSVAYIDHHLGLLFNELERRDLLRNTVVIITSDHGEQFGEHNLFAHGNSLYIPLLQVPLVMSFPSRIPAGLRISEAVSLRDLGATIFDLIGMEDVAGFPGTSLARFWTETGDKSSKSMNPAFSEVTSLLRVPARYPISKGDMSSLVLNQYHYIKNGDGREELYDFEQDPGEERDLADSEDGRRLREQFRSYLSKVLASEEISK